MLVLREHLMGKEKQSPLQPTNLACDSLGVHQDSGVASDCVKYTCDSMGAHQDSGVASDCMEHNL